MQFNFSVGEIRILIEALNKSAARHEAEARFKPISAKRHDDKAAAMRNLSVRLVRQQNEHHRAVPVVKELQAAGIIGPGTEIIEGVTAYRFIDSKQKRSKTNE